MKSVFLIALWLAVTHAFPNPDLEKPQEEKCKLTRLISLNKLVLPELDIGFDDKDELAIGTIDDPLIIQNFSVTINEEFLTGTYSLTNGVVEGLSALNHDFGYNSDAQELYANATLNLAKLVGEYEIVDGKAKIPALGTHSFSGKGPLSASVSGVTAPLGVRLVIDPVTNFLSIADLKVDFNFQNASVVAKNLVVDGVPVQWEEVNENIRPIYESIWVEVQGKILNIQEEINSVLEGCSLMDLIELISLLQPAKP